MNITTNKMLAAGLLLGFSSFSAQADLTAVGGNLVDDNTAGITWSSDANLLGSMEAGNANLITTIVSDVGSVTDSLGVHTLSSGDFGTNGLTDWWGAQAFTSYLNQTSYLGYHTWQQPAYTDLATQFNTNLGETPSLPLDNSSSNYSLFTHLQADAIWWSNAELSGSASNAIDFNTYYGYAGYADKNNQFYAWPTLPGNVSLAVPEPATLWLFISGLLGLTGLNKRKRAG